LNINISYDRRLSEGNRRPFLRLEAVLITSSKTMSSRWSIAGTSCVTGVVTVVVVVVVLLLLPEGSLAFLTLEVAKDVVVSVSETDDSAATMGDGRLVALALDLLPPNLAFLWPSDGAPPVVRACAGCCPTLDILTPAVGVKLASALFPFRAGKRKPLRAGCAVDVTSPPP